MVQFKQEGRRFLPWTDRREIVRFHFTKQSKYKTKEVIMLWHLEHKHTGATCFSKDEEKKALWDKAMDSASENGVMVHHFLVNASAHRFFFVVEAPDYESLEATFGECKTLGEIEMTPVVAWQKA